MTPLETELEKYLGSTDNESGSFLSKDLIKIRKNAFMAGWDARNNDVYGKLKTDLEKCKVLINDLQTLQLSNGFADKAKKLLKELK